MGGGWELFIHIRLVPAPATSQITLPYLTLPYLKLVLNIAIVYYITLD